MDRYAAATHFTNIDERDAVFLGKRSLKCAIAGMVTWHTQIHEHEKVVRFRRPAVRLGRAGFRHVGR